MNFLQLTPTGSLSQDGSRTKSLAGAGGVLVAIFRGSVLVACLCLFAVGCRGRAQEDLYRQTLQREVRQLEDQLYEADYENRILIEKLRRERAAKPADCPQSSGRIPAPIVDPGYVPVESEQFDLKDGLDDTSVDDAFQDRDDRSGKPRPLKDPESIQPGKRTPDRDRKEAEDDGLPDMDDLIDPGTLVDPDTLVDPSTLQPPMPTPSPDATPDSKEGMRLPGEQLLPPPGGPVPPGESDLKIDPVEPGPPTPPNAPNGRPDGPPGKIDLPGVSMLGGLGAVAGSTPRIELQPAKIRIDAPSSSVRLALENAGSSENEGKRDSSPEKADADSESTPLTEGVDLVIRADDQYGHPIALLGRSHDPTAALQEQGTASPRPLPKETTRLSVIALDPAKSGEEAQLGRWDFGSEQLRQLETTSLATAANGYALTLPIRWRDHLPSGEAVVFFARLETEQRDLRCESEIGLKKQPSMAGWLPRR